MGWTQRLLASSLLGTPYTRSLLLKFIRLGRLHCPTKYKLWHWPDISINCWPDSDQFDHIHAHKHTRIAIALDMPGVWFYFLACRQFGCQSVDRWIASIGAIAYMVARHWGCRLISPGFWLAKHGRRARTKFQLIFMSKSIKAYVAAQQSVRGNANPAYLVGNRLLVFSIRFLVFGFCISKLAASQTEQCYANPTVK